MRWERPYCSGYGVCRVFVIEASNNIPRSGRSLTNQIYEGVMSAGKVNKLDISKRNFNESSIEKRIEQRSTFIFAQFAVFVFIVNLQFFSRCAVLVAEKRNTKKLNNQSHSTGSCTSTNLVISNPRCNQNMNAFPAQIRTLQLECARPFGAELPCPNCDNGKWFAI